MPEGWGSAWDGSHQPARCRATLDVPSLLPSARQPAKGLRSARFDVVFLDETMRITRGDRVRTRGATAGGSASAAGRVAAAGCSQPRRALGGAAHHPLLAACALLWLQGELRVFLKGMV